MSNSVKQLESEIEKQSNLLHTERLDVSFGELLSMYENGEIIIKPAFQRFFRWSEEQKTKFIESLLLGIPIPPIFVATNNEGVWELVDGLQRLSTFLSFAGVLKSEDQGIKKTNNWALQEGSRVQAIKGFTYATLPLKFRLVLKRAVCRVEILKWNSNYDMRYELFNRLNTGGTPLTEQEIRNCVFRDISPKFNDFLKELAAYPSFVKSVNLPTAMVENLFNEELVLRFLSLYGDPSIKTSISQHMTKFMERALKNGNYDYDTNRKLFKDLFDIISKLRINIFKRSNGDFATSLYDAITYGIATNIEKYRQMNSKDIMKIIDTKLLTDQNFMCFSRRGGNNQRVRILNRLKVAKEIF